MKHFFRGGRELPDGQGCVRPLADDHVIKLTSYQDPIDKNNNRLLRPLGRSRSDAREGEGVESLRTTFGLASPLLRPYITDSSRIQHRFNTSESRIVDEKVIKRCSEGNETPKLVRSRHGSDQEQGGYEAPDLAPTVYQLSSAQVLPWFNQKSLIPRWFLGRSSMDTRSQSCNHRGVTVRSSSKSGSRSGLGRYQVGTLSTYLSSFARYFIASEAKDRQTIGKEQATDRQRTGKEKAHKYQAKPKPSPEKEQGTDRERVENKQRITVVSTLGVLRQYVAGIVPIGIKRIYSRGIVCLTQALCKAIGLHNTYIIPTLYLHNSRISGVLKNRKVSTLPLNLLRTVYEPETHIKGTGNIHKRYMPDTCSVHVQHNNGTCLTHQPHKNDTIKCGNEGDGNGVSDRLLLSLERYSRRFGTQRSDESDVCNDGKVIEDLREKRLILKGFRELCKEFRSKVESMLVDDEIKRQRGLKEVGCSVKFLDVSVPPPTGGYSRHDDTKRLKTYSLQLITLFCVLFSYPDVLGTSAMAQSQHRATSRIDFGDKVLFAQSPAKVGAPTGPDSENSENTVLISYKYIFNTTADKHNEKYVSKSLIKNYPLIIYDFDYKQTPDVRIGDDLPTFLKAIAFQYVDSGGETKIGTLSEFMDSKLLILDFWATWCSPCVESMDKWNVIAKEIDGVKVLGVMLDHNIRAQYFGASRDWGLPILFGPETNIINSFFFDRPVISRSAWIMDGKLIGITNTKGYDAAVVRDLIHGKSVDLPMASEWIYSTSN